MIISLFSVANKLGGLAGALIIAVAGSNLGAFDGDGEEMADLEGADAIRRQARASTSLRAVVTLLLEQRCRRDISNLLASHPISCTLLRLSSSVGKRRVASESHIISC
jgi:hypothetical protein